MHGQALSEMLHSTRPPYVVLAAGIEARLLSRLVRTAAKNQRVAVLEGAAMTTWEGFFSEFIRVFDFPGYFSWNLNSFSEIVCDLSWIDAKGHIALVLNFDQLLDAGEKDIIDVLLEYRELFGEDWATEVRTREWWDRDAVPFHMVLHSVAPAPSFRGVRNMLEGR